MYQLEETTYLYILILLPIILLVFLYNKYWQKITIKKYFDDATFNFLSPELSSTKSYIKTSLTLLIISILVFGLVNPKIGTELKTVKREGVDIVFAIDVSKSMLAEDIAPNRIFKAKRLVSEIFNKLGSDRVGIIAYASTAIPVLPITNDFSSAKMFLESLNTDMLSSQGTSIVEAIELSKGYFDDENQTNRVLCILSDGEDHEYDENQFISIIILSVGLGSTKGAPIPIKENNIVKSYKKDDKGEVVITKLNDELLKKIATQSSGKYIKGDNTSLVVDEIINELKEMDKKEFESKQFVSFKDQFQWFLGAGLLLFLVNSIIFDKKTKWIEKLNLFNENN
jgi:Ca-activated chloride channel family protein